MLNIDEERMSRDRSENTKIIDGFVHDADDDVGTALADNGDTSTRNDDTMYQASKRSIGHGIDLNLVMVVIGTLVMIVRRSVADEMSIGTFG